MFINTVSHILASKKFIKAHGRVQTRAACHLETLNVFHARLPVSNPDAPFFRWWLNREAKL